MARRPRLHFPGAVYHVRSRGNRKLPIFDDDEDRRLFLAIVHKAAVRYGIRCYSFCLMGNHYHLVFDTPLDNLSEAMRHINGLYTQASNRRHRRTGHVFEGRFRSLVIQREGYLRRANRYVVLNPVRARMVNDATAWPWSSYRATAGLEPVPPFLDLDWLEWTFGGASREEAQVRYRLYVNNPVKKHARLDWQTPAVGQPAFETAVRETAKIEHPDRLLPRTCRAMGRPTLQELFNLVGESRSARNMMIRQAHVAYGYRLAEIATFLNLHPSTASVILRRIEARMTLKNSQ